MTTRRQRPYSSPVEKDGNEPNLPGEELYSSEVDARDARARRRETDRHLAQYGLIKLPVSNLDDDAVPLHVLAHSSPDTVLREMGRWTDQEARASEMLTAIRRQIKDARWEMGCMITDLRSQGLTKAEAESRLAGDLRHRMLALRIHNQEILADAVKQRHDDFASAYTVASRVLTHHLEAASATRRRDEHTP
jgi:hypothetical protein